LYGVSPAFLAALRRSHRVAVRADVQLAPTATSPALTLVTDLPVVDGIVTVDENAAVRRTCNLTLVDTDGSLTPTGAADPLAPYGREVVLRRGVVLADGTTEFAPLGVFRFEEVEVVDEGSRSIRLAGFDRSATVAAARFESPWAVAPGTRYTVAPSGAGARPTGAIADLLADRFPGLAYSFAVDPSTTTPLLAFEEGADPWEAATRMARNLGCELFFDAAGVCVLRREVDPTDPTLAVSFVYAEGAEATVLSVIGRFSAKDGHNKVVVTGEPVDGNAPVRAEAYDADPASPTYYLGPYGKRPRFHRSEFVTSTAQAQAAADALLQRELGGTEQVAFTALVNPAHEAGDLVVVTREALGLSNVVAVLSSFSIPLAPGGSMSATTRRRRSA
jgi:hypothetical protein